MDGVEDLRKKCAQKAQFRIFAISLEICTAFEALDVRIVTVLCLAAIQMVKYERHDLQRL